PFTGNELHGKNAKEFTPHFTHPLNYYCLMNMPEKLYEYWRKCEVLYNDLPTDYKLADLEKYKNLKFCLGHYGGSEEWKKYLFDPWLPKKGSTLTIDKNLLHLPEGKWVHKNDDEIIVKSTRINWCNIRRWLMFSSCKKWVIIKEGKEIGEPIAHSWHSIISDMLSLKYETTKQPVFPNLYSDISYNLANKKVLPLLKVRLESDPLIAKKILFGSDFFMVSTKASEREITMNIRSFIGEKNFDLISKENPLNYLSSEFMKIPNLNKTDK
ncbi:MAG: hypothetical protein HQ541_10730, partial [Mariniphaga sp.]|nr:hypothetical protein [Mariniphaga sp.]